MPQTHDEQKQALIAQLCDLARTRLPAQNMELASAFIQRYYASAAIEDLLARPAEDLYGAALSHWQLALQRRPGQPHLRIYNPHYEHHGWQSTHTVVEVVSDDMPFLVDSLSMEILKQDYTIHLIIHPVMRVHRDSNGNLQQVFADNDRQADGVTEAVMRFEITRQTDEKALALLRQELARVLNDVRAVVEDWSTMRERIAEVIATIEAQKLPISTNEKEEALNFLRWVNNHHFTFIGFRAYDLTTENGQDVLRQVPGSGLGILRDSDINSARASQGFAHIPPPLRAFARQPTLLIITKSTSISDVHRPVHLDYLGIKRFNEQSQVIGEWRFLGLYSSLAYSSRPSDIPILRKKVEHVLQGSGYPPASHGRKALAHILDTFPRDEMFQCTEQELNQIATGILQVQERHKLGLFLREDLFGRFITALVYIPRERFHTELRRRIQDILMQALNGETVEFNTQLSDSPLARVHFIIRTRPDRIPAYDVAQLQARLAETMLSWQDELRIALHEHYGEEHGDRLFQRYAEAFPPAYRDDYSPRTAVIDIQHLEQINEPNPFSLNLYRPPEQGNDELLRFKVFGRDHPMTLSDVLPMLEQMGLRIITARPYEIEPHSGGPFWILDFDMATHRGVDALAIKDAFQEAFAQVCSGNMENDGFNRLVLAAGLHWRSVVMVRALCKYLLQTRTPFSQSYMEQSLAGNAAITQLLVQLFETRFDPESRSGVEQRCADLNAQIEKALEGVSSLDEDRILRMFLGLIQAMLRTNYYQRNADGTPKAYVSFKFDPAQIPTLPQPRPMYEIFVYSPRVEAVHLRGGPVARGGIRWSDRREDFRTEILGLMKAQMVKNAVIVPVGAKGGFVVKHPPSGDDRDALQSEVVFCYRTFICGLLDLTDNLAEGKVVPPPAVVRYDRDDPYLVVAADKGTATFSDIANRLSADYRFWLGDAFASGGSSGYDHKKMAITARGAWESVKRHFRELGVDTQNQPFTAVGIGDMAGDVFGNGMLLSRHLRLIAAFNHLHIFIDPNPDPATSFEERQRLFNLPRSAWSDYDAKLISPGGGVYSRRAKSVALSAEARAALGIDAEHLTPNELIQAMLCAPVDLLWNGGIGTFVKAGNESHADAGDRSNDALRVDAAELRCKVVGEGGNLGFTQLARVEYARRGGRINTDAIDNSGGVDCSDHEVNIKILLSQVIASGDMTLKQRDLLLTEMTEEVAQLVLADNYLQTEALSITATQAGHLLSDHAQLIRMLEKEGRLKRKLEFLPGDEEIARRETAQEGLTRPELAVLLAYSKIRLFEELHSSDISEDPYLSHELIGYFPTPLREPYASRMETHPLRREIIATQITNSMVNRMGSTFWMRMHHATGHSPAAIARAYTAAREIFGMRAIWKAIETLDNHVNANVQLEMLIETRRLLDRATLWLLRHTLGPVNIAATIDRYAAHSALLSARLPRLLRNGERTALKQRERQLNKAGVPKDLAAQIAILDPLFTALDHSEIAEHTGTDILRVAESYYVLSATLDLFWLKEQIQALPRHDPWQRKARIGLLEELHAALRILTQEMLEAAPDAKSIERRLAAWFDHNPSGVDHWRNLVAEIRAGGKIELAMLSVAMREIRALARGSQH